MKSPHAWSEYCKLMTPQLVETCTATPAAAGSAGLARALAAALPEWRFRPVLSRGGWYRLGGVVDGDGRRLADDLEAWAAAELAARDGDLGRLADELAEPARFATRLVGRTHYLVAPVGDGNDDFLQLEIEELQEVRGHRLFAGEPASLEELVDPRTGAGSVTAQPLGLPCYVFRRVQHVGAFLARLRAQKPERAGIQRMLDDWARSSAGAASAFCNHWVVATREHLDRYQQPRLSAQAIATAADAAPPFAAPAGSSGLRLQDALTRFDRAAGYPMAWFFHLLTTKAVPQWAAQAVVEDALAGFAYLPQRDVDTVRDWLHAPYSA
ncbi:hypothetical protein [Azospira restricta]|uniref:Uncharacterized protein n=1 Tax=Azospira restricta TaxID=404405 RepID=A0A974SR88_9RHOO|nr:hypothetical protein [Azospira restricta]QRJ64972.1 hypothetical protein IWH25_06425 [Azospira restricta]